jgi:RNA polymerase sigma-70 factor, ECF subfamily
MPKKSLERGNSSMNEGLSRQGELIDTTSERPEAVPVSTDDWHLINLLRSGDEAAFETLINHYHTAMLRIAMVYVLSRTVAEEVVQETWMAVLESLPRFEGRSSLRTWLFRILSNRAKTRAQREGRTIPFSSLANVLDEADEPAVEPARFRPAGQQWAGGWVAFPASWEESPEERLLSQETRMYIEKAIAALSPNQREIITLRDIEGWSSEETCSFLGISEANQRVLLHRARSKVRGALEKYFTQA